MGINRRDIAITVLAISITAIIILIATNAFAQSLNPKPILMISTNAYQVYYYNATASKPILIIRGYLNNNPVPLTVSLFALGEGHIYTIGYYYGVSSVNISLTVKPIMDMARETVKDLVLNGNSPDVVWPSLLVFITYFDKSTNETRTVVAAIPYSPIWIINNESIVINLNADFSRVKPVKVVYSYGTTNTTSPIMKSSVGPYGFVRPYNCLGNTNVPNATPPLTYAGAGIIYWEPHACAGFNGSIPVLWIA